MTMPYLQPTGRRRRPEEEGAAPVLYGPETRPANDAAVVPAGGGMPPAAPPPNPRARTRQAPPPSGAPAYGGTTPWTGGGFDPNNPNPQRSMDGRADLGANNGFNLANIWDQWYGQMRRGQGQQGERDAAAAASRGRADATRGSYQPPPAWDAPTWQDPYSFTGERPELSTEDDDFALLERFRQTQGGPATAERVSAPSVGGFGSAFRTYAQGATNQFLTALQDRVRGLTDNAAGRGRLNTGFYDEDVGELSRTLSREATDALHTRALDAAALDQQAALQSGQWEYGARTGNADRALEAQRLNMGNALDIYGATGGRALQRDALRQGIFESDRGFEYGRSRDARSDFEGDRGFGRAVYESDRGFGRGLYESDRAFDEDRYRFDEGAARDARDYFTDTIAGARDWRYGQLQREDQERSFLEQALPGIGTIAGGIIGGPAGAAIGGQIGSGLTGGGVNPSAFYDPSRATSRFATPVPQFGEVPGGGDLLGGYDSGDYFRRRAGYGGI